MTVPLRKRIKRSVRSAIVRTVIRLLSLLPLGAALALGGAVGRVAYLLAGKTRRRALGSLAVAFPERSEAERAALARGMFVHLGRAAMEVVAIRSYDAELDTYVELANAELLEAKLADDTSRARAAQVVASVLDAMATAREIRLRSR